MNYMKLEVAAHAVSQETSDCGCVKSVTARIVLVDEHQFMRAVLAVGDAAATFEESVETAMRKLGPR